MSYRKVKKGNAKKQSNVYLKKPIGNQARKANSGGRTRIPAIIAVIILVGVIGSIVTGILYSPTRGECKEIVSDFQTACNELNTTNILNCLKPSVSNPLKIALGIGSVVTSQSSDEMLESILEALGGGLNDITNNTNLSVRAIFETMEIEPKRISLPGKTRKVTCKAIISGLQQKVYIYVTKESGDVYISKVAFSE